MVSNQILTVTLQGLFDQDMSFNVDMKHKCNTDSKSSLIQNTAAKILTELIKKDLS